MFIVETVPISYMELDFTPILVSIVLVIGIIMTTKAFMVHKSTGSKTLKNKIKDHEDYEQYLKKQITVYKNKSNNMEKGPQIEGDIDSLGDILPNVVGEFADFAPKWLKPFLKDPESQKQIIGYITKNPEVAKKLFGKIVGKKSTEEQDSGDLSGL
jgi:hypothetical protein